MKKIGGALSKVQDRLIKAYAPQLVSKFPAQTRGRIQSRVLGKYARARAPSYVQPRPSLSRKLKPLRFRNPRASEGRSPAGQQYSGTFPSDVLYLQKDNGSVLVRIYCAQELAYDIVVRDRVEELRKQYGLEVAEYDGDAFAVQSADIVQLQACVAELRNEINEIRRRHVTRPVANSGTAADLKKARFHRKIKYKGEGYCIICSETFKRNQLVRRTSCLHLFHMKCIEPWLTIKRVCPIDKMPI